MTTSIRVALRSIRRAPRAALLTAVCVAAGVAASSTALTLAYTVTVRALPFPDGDRLMRVWLADDTDPRQDLSIPDLSDVAASVPAFDAVAGTARTRIVAQFDRGAVRLRGESVTPNYFDLLALRPNMGRVFGPDDFAPDAPRVALISAATWRTHYGSDPNVLGRTLRTEQATWSIVGVMPPGFDGTIENDVVEFWLPLPQYTPAALLTNRRTRQSWAIGRLAPGANAEAAAGQLAAVAGSLREREPDLYRGLTLRAESFGENWRGPLRATGLLLLGAALLLLVIAVVNVSGMALARALDRRREFAIRAALGADTRRVALLPFLESALAALAGGVAGLLLAPLLLDGFLTLAPIALPAYLTPRLDARVLLAVAALCVAAAAGAGMLPALEARRTDVNDVLRDGSRGQISSRGGQRAGRWLVAGQVALTTLLVAVGSLLARSYLALSNAPLGFTADVARFAVTASPLDLGENAAAYRAKLLEAVRAVPGVRSAGLAWWTLPPWDSERPTFAHAALGDVPPDAQPRLSAHAVDSGLFDALAIPLLAGRGIAAGDHETAEPVVVISHALAEHLGGAQRAIGSELRVTESGYPLPARARIVGVVGNVAWDGVAEQNTGRFLEHSGAAPRPAFDAYWSMGQLPLASHRVLSLAARTTVDPADVLEPVQRALGAAVPRSAIHWVSSMREELALEYRSASFALLLTVAFGGGALLLAATGLFAVLAHTVARRVPEFGIRLALGASPAGVRWQVLKGGLALTGAGAAVGLGLAVLAGQALRRLLYGVAPVDPLAFGAAVTVLLLVAAAACWWPARRAARVDPMEALRSE